MHFLINVSLPARRLCFCAVLIFSVTVLLRAEIPPVPEYEIGDLAEADVRTPVDFDAIDPLATKQAREKSGQNMSPVFRFWPKAAKDAEGEFRAGFARQHEWFIGALQQHYRHSKLNPVTINHPSFGLFLGWVQKNNPGFPCATNIARAWALGDSAKAVQEELALKLRQTMQHYIHADTSPSDFQDGPVSMFTVKGAEVIPDLDTVAKRSLEVPKEKLYPLSEARAELARSFSSAEQPLARFVSQYLRENCAFDPGLTDRLAKTKAANLWVTQHYQAGGAIIESGQRIDEKNKSALEALSAKRVQEQQKLATAAARQEKISAMKESLQSGCAVIYVMVMEAGTFDYVLWLALVGLTIGLYLLRRRRKRALKRAPAPAIAPASVMAYTVVLHPERQETIFLPVKTTETEALPAKSPPPEINLLHDASWEERARQAEEHAQELLEMVRSGLAPHLAKELMNRLVQELVAQRRALLQTQQVAGQEIASIEARFTTLCRQLQDQIKAYEHRTQHLEEKLADKDEENSELLKAMIATQRKLQSAQEDSERRS